MRGRDFGAIKIAQRFSAVEVLSPAADQVIAALRQATIEGRRPVVRPDRSDG